MKLQNLLQNKTYNIRLRFFIYLRLICMNAEWKYDKWQLDDWYFALDSENTEVMFIRCRGGSKTRDMVFLAVFFGMIGYKVKWFASSDDQLEQASEYAKDNFFVLRTVKNRWDLKFGRNISVSCLTKKRAHSKRLQKLFIDEEEDAEPELYRAALGTGVGQTDWQVFHIGTTEVGTVFESNYKKLLGRNAVRETPVTKLSWTTYEKEVTLRYYGSPQWYIDQELLCKWTVPEGVVLSNIVKVDHEIEFVPENQFGIDWGNYDICVGGFQEGDDFFFNFEGVFDYTSQPSDLLDVISGYNIEAENGGYNYSKSEKLSLDTTCSRVPWRKETVGDRIRRIREFKHIYINPDQCPKLYNDLKTTSWNPRKPGFYLKTEDHPCHYWDASLHCVGAEPMKIFGRDESPIKVSTEERIERLKEMNRKHG